MKDELQFDTSTYDLDGLLGMSERSQADFLFMIQDENEEVYYLDRQEIGKYDNSFSSFVRRVDRYLDLDENRGLFILFAFAEGEQLRILNGKLIGTHTLDMGEIELSEEVYYGAMLHIIDGEYVFKEALYIKDKGDDHAEIIPYANDLSKLLAIFVEEFE